MNIRSNRIVKNFFLNRIKSDIMNVNKIKKKKKEKSTHRISFEKKIINVCQKSFTKWMNNLKTFDFINQKINHVLKLFNSMIYCDWKLCQIHCFVLNRAFQMFTIDKNQLMKRFKILWKHRFSINVLKQQHLIWFFTTQTIFVYRIDYDFIIKTWNFVI
jgi:hypothetical protein